VKAIQVSGGQQESKGDTMADEGLQAEAAAVNSTVEKLSNLIRSVKTEIRVLTSSEQIPRTALVVLNESVDTAEGVVDGLRKLCIHLPLEHIYPVVH
jgi:hypothetical protein